MFPINQRHFDAAFEKAPVLQQSAHIPFRVPIPMGMKQPRFNERDVLDHVRIEHIHTQAECARLNREIDRHHYLRNTAWSWLN
jgi:hypothetical protein